MTLSRYHPTPTDYNGVRFRSKSEAIFARALDLTGSGVVESWDYERTKIEDWVIDFDITTGVFSYDSCGGGDSVARILLEYKPGLASDAYKERWETAMAERAMPDKTYPVIPVLFEGSVFGDSWGVQIARWSPDLGVVVGIFESVWNQIPEARNYRFDLEEGGAL